ncbi:hypothetical protein ACFPB0_10175 [Glycocaulis abyssi]|uniref:Uncharacterized protein n=2 Tax=Glycocaulis abyssi TaxID=1433403 RepID=A0ABV9NDA9_9PROT
MGWTQWLGVQPGGRLAIYVDGIHYDFVVDECEPRIPPGEQGKAELITLSEALLETDTRVGSVVELKGGATLLGHARIDSMARVWIERDRNNEKGYRISRGPVPL